MSALLRSLEWIGVSPDDDLIAQLSMYRAWLADEGVRSGGIGPGEGDRLDSRHLADSLLFAGVWDQEAVNPVLDVGTGVGLPGVPLAIVFPNRRFVLLDRSQRRVELANRAVRVLALPNVDVRQGDIAGYDWSDSTVVARASIPAAQLLELANARSPRELLVAGSHVRRPDVAGYEVMEIPTEILDRPVWILRMARS